MRDKKRLLILSCSARKSGSRVCRAIDRYLSPAFYLLRRHLRRNPDPNLVIWILSARYGLIGSKYRIETYDLAMTPDRARHLRKKISRQFKKLFTNNFGDDAPSEVFCHLPQNYRDALDEELLQLEKTTVVRFAGGSPGEKLRELKNWLENTEEIVCDGRKEALEITSAKEKL
jgi:hypothetical protein